jgi:hypothetical protein
VAAVSYADGGPARPWWEFSRERIAGRGSGSARTRSRRRRVA